MGLISFTNFTSKFKLRREIHFEATPGKISLPILHLSRQHSYHVMCKYYRDRLTHLPRISAAYMRQWIGSTLVQIMACRLFGAKSLSEPVLGYCRLDPKEQTSVKLQSKYGAFYSRKRIWKYRLANGGHFVQVEMSYLNLDEIQQSFHHISIVIVGEMGPWITASISKMYTVCTRRMGD